MATGLELVAGILSGLGVTEEWLDEAPARTEAKRLAADSVRAAELLTTLHLEDFPREEAPAPQPGPRRWRNAWFINEDEQAAVVEAHAQAQSRWELLLAHDQSTVITTIEAAFADNASHSACIDAGTDNDGPYVTLVVHYPGPEIAEGLVQVGTTVRPRSKREKNELYRRALASTVIATAKEALCCAPAATHARVVVLRYDLRRKLTTRHKQLDAIYAGSFHRGLLDVKWKKRQNPVNAIRQAWGVRINQGHDGSLKPLGRLAGQDLCRLVEEIAAATSTDEQPTS